MRWWPRRDRIRRRSEDIHYEALKAALENPDLSDEQKDAIAKAELSSMMPHLTYDPFTFKSRRF